MGFSARFVHTSIVARDWRRLADFYQRVFGCIPVPPERHITGQWIEAATGVPNAEIDGVHLRLPGHGKGGPPWKSPNTIGWRPETDQRSIGPASPTSPLRSMTWRRLGTAGGGTVGDLVSLDVPGAWRVMFIYVSDPEGSIVELQKWLW